MQFAFIDIVDSLIRRYFSINHLIPYLSQVIWRAINQFNWFICDERHSNGVRKVMQWAPIRQFRCLTFWRLMQHWSPREILSYRVTLSTICNGQITRLKSSNESDAILFNNNKSDAITDYYHLQMRVSTVIVIIHQALGEYTHSYKQSPLSVLRISII